MEFHTGFISWRRERDSNSCRGISPNTISSIEPSEIQSKTNKKTIHRYIIRCIVYKKNVPVVSILYIQIWRWRAAENLSRAARKRGGTLREVFRLSRERDAGGKGGQSLAGYRRAVPALPGPVPLSHSKCLHINSYQRHQETKVQRTGTHLPGGLIGKGGGDQRQNAAARSEVWQR